jgi:hypothetical protein
MVVNFRDEAAAVDFCNETFREMQRGFDATSRLVDYSLVVEEAESMCVAKVTLALDVANTEAAIAWADATAKGIQNRFDGDDVLAYTATFLTEYDAPSFEEYEEGDFTLALNNIPNSAPYTDEEIELLMRRQDALQANHVEFQTQLAEKGISPHSAAYVVFAKQFADSKLSLPD